MRRSRLKILPARCLSFLGFILVMLVCPTIAEINIGIGDVYEPGHSDSELQHPATKFLRNGFEVCQMEEGPRREDIPFEQPPDSKIASLEEAVRYTRKSDPKHLRNAIRRGERNQNCYDSRKNEDSVMRRNAIKIQYNSKAVSREASEDRRRNLGNPISSRKEGSSIERSQRRVEVPNETRERVTSERRNDMIKSHRRTSTVPKEERYNPEELSHRRKEERRILRRNTANESSRNVDTRRTSDEGSGESSERLNSVRTRAKYSNINERRDDFFRQSTAERENALYRFTRRSSSTRNQARISPELVQKSEKEIVEDERRLKSRGMSSIELRRIDTQRRQTESESREFSRRTVSMTRTAELDPTDRFAINTERQRRNREERLNPNMPNSNRKQQREFSKGDHRTIRTTRSLERRSMIDSERQDKFSVLTSDTQRRDRKMDRNDAARRSVRMVRSVDSIRSDMRSVVENERQQKMRETTVRSTRQNENRRVDRLSERGESTRLPHRGFRSLESILVEKGTFVDNKRQHRTSGIQISNDIIEGDNIRQKRKSERRDSSLPSTRLVRFVRSMPSDSSMIPIMDSERRQVTPDLSLNSRRLGIESNRKDVTRLTVTAVRSVERESRERRSLLDSERQQSNRGAPLNTIRQTDTRRKQRESERRYLPQRFVRLESIMTPLYSVRGERALNTVPTVERQERDTEMRDTAHRSSEMVRSIDLLERRSIFDNERSRENRDRNYNKIRLDKNRSVRRESERRDVVHNALKMERRTEMDGETQQRFRDISSNSRRQQRESQRRDNVQHSIRMAMSLNLVRTERTPVEERRLGTREATANFRRQEIELGERKTDRRSVRMVRSTRSVSQEVGAYADNNNMERSQDVTLNPSRRTENRRQQREYERRDIARRDVRIFRSLESIPAERKLAVGFDRQDRFQDITLNTRSQKRELENRDTARRSLRIGRSLVSLATDKRSVLNSERKQENPDTIVTRSLEKRSVIDLERQERLPYFALRSPRKEKESERRYSARSTVGVISSSESNRIERRSMFNYERQQSNRDVSGNIQRQGMEVERRKPEFRSVRRVKSAEVSPSDRSVVDITTQSSSSNSQRRKTESERRDLAQLVVRVTRSLKSIPSQRTFSVEYERRQITRDSTMLTSRQPNSGRERRESEKGDITRRTNRMTRSVESRETRSEAGSERHQLTRDATRNFRDQENRSERRNLARNSRISEQRNDRQRREMAQRLSLEKDKRTTIPTSNEGRSENSLIASRGNSRLFSPYINYLDGSSRNRRVKESRVHSFVSDTEEPNRSFVSRASPNRERSSPETSVPPSKGARNVDRRASSNLRTSQNHRLLQIREDRLGSRSRSTRILSQENTGITTAVGSQMRNQNYPPMRRINLNIPNSILIKMERIIGNKEGMFGTMLAETRKGYEKVPLLGGNYLFERQISPDTHLKARNVIVISSDRLLGSVRRSAIRNSHLERDTISRTADLRKKLHADKESDLTVRISRNVARDSITRSSKLGRYALTEHRKDSAGSKHLMNDMSRSLAVPNREASILPSDIRVSKTMRRSQHLSGRINEKTVLKTFQGNPIAKSYDAEESYNVILRNGQGENLLAQLSQNRTSPVTYLREMDQPNKIVHIPKPFEDVEYDQKIGHGFTQDNLFSLTIGGSVAAFLISTSLK